jgi:hypothetical protein
MIDSRSINAVAYHDSKIYVFGGYTEDDNFKNSEMLDMALKQWNRIADLP